jgi:hypothetical protein
VPVDDFDGDSCGACLPGDNYLWVEPLVRVEMHLQYVLVVVLINLY